MKKELWKGNEAIAPAAIRAGCNCFFGYPITPQNEIPEYMSLHLPKAGGVFVQSESELAAINMVYGAAAPVWAPSSPLRPTIFRPPGAAATAITAPLYWPPATFRRRGI